MKKLLVLAALTLTTAACHQHTNPLKTLPPEKAAILLLQASKYAEAQAGFSQRGVGFANCMKENMLKLDCHHFLQDMLSFSKKNPDMQTLTLADLEDKVFFEEIAEIYEMKRFNSI